MWNNPVGGFGADDTPRSAALNSLTTMGLYSADGYGPAVVCHPRHADHPVARSAVGAALRWFVAAGDTPRSALPRACQAPTVPLFR
jgi:hypothetical protein